MNLKEAIEQVLLEAPASSYTDPSTNFDVKIRSGGYATSKYIADVEAAFQNEHGQQVEAIIGFVNDYTVELSVSVDSETINSSRGMFKSLSTAKGFFRKVLPKLLNKDPAHIVHLVYFKFKDDFGNDISDQLFQKAVAPDITALLSNTRGTTFKTNPGVGDTWENIGRKSLRGAGSVYLWKRKSDKNARDTRASLSGEGPDGEPSWYQSNKPNLDTGHQFGDLSDKDRTELSQMHADTDRLRDRIRAKYRKESIEFVNRIRKEIYEELMGFYQ